uniref:Uncharacterized protein n=1 Tax=Palpitomonas bilix TaxID=652834 RepID=A0A7S3G4U2_9EUKA
MDWEYAGKGGEIPFDESFTGCALRFILTPIRSDGVQGDTLKSDSTQYLFPEGPPPLTQGDVDMVVRDVDIITQPASPSLLMVGNTLDIGAQHDIPNDIGWEATWMINPAPPTSVLPTPASGSTTSGEEVKKEGNAELLAKTTGGLKNSEHLSLLSKEGWKTLKGMEGEFSIDLTDEMVGKRVGCFVVPSLNINDATSLPGMGLWIECLYPVSAYKREPFSVAMKLFCDDNEVVEDSRVMVNSTLKVVVSPKGVQREDIVHHAIQWYSQNTEEGGPGAPWLPLQDEEDATFLVPLSFIGKLIRATFSIERKPTGDSTDVSPLNLEESATIPLPVSIEDGLGREVEELIAGGIEDVDIMFVDENDEGSSAQVSADGSKITVKSDETKQKLMKVAIDKHMLLEDMEADSDALGSHVFGILVFVKDKLKGQMVLKSQRQRDILYVALERMRKVKVLGSAKAAKQWKKVGNVMRMLK